MIVARTRSEAARALDELRGRGQTLALVPTMGFLHEGHLSLVDEGARQAGCVVASIFVNPLQFGASEDLDRYPRDEAKDLEMLERRGVSLAFVPSDAEMYPEGHPQVTVSPGSLGRRLCGAFRPGHFRGVLTVVAKLFGMLRPDVAVFGQKDFQQAVLIRHMVRDLELGVRVVVRPIVREPDGLAMSSRNAYLSPAEREQATGLFAALSAARRRFLSGERQASRLIGEVRRVLEPYSLLELQYAEIVHPDTLEAVELVADGSVLAVAGFCGTTRLIDNMILTPGS